MFNGAVTTKLDYCCSLHAGCLPGSHPTLCSLLC